MHYIQLFCASFTACDILVIEWIQKFNYQQQNNSCGKYKGKKSLEGSFDVSADCDQHKKQYIIQACGA